MTETVQTSDGAGDPLAQETASADNFAPFFRRADWLAFGVTAATALAVHLWTLAPDVTLENSGGLATAANYGGVAYPPGFPAWTIYSWAFSKLLPFSNIAWRMAVGSAFAVAVMCGLVALMVSRGGLMLLEGRATFASWNRKEQDRLRVVCGWVAGMVLGLSTPAWREAVIVDIWTFGNMLFTIVLCLLMRWSFEPARRKHLYWALFVFGLSLTGNQEFIVIAPAVLLWVLTFDRKLGRDLYLLLLAVIAVVWVLKGKDIFLILSSFADLNTPLHFALMVAGVAVVVRSIGGQRPGSEWRPAIGCLICWLAGTTVCFYLPVAAMADPPMDWGYPRTVDGFLHLLARGQYDRLHTTGILTYFISQLWWVAKDTGKGFGWFYYLFAVVPLCFWWWAGDTARRWLFSLIAMLLCAGPLMIATINPGPDLFSQYYTRPYYIPMYEVLAILTGLGFVVLGSVIAKPAAVRNESSQVRGQAVPGQSSG